MGLDPSVDTLGQGEAVGPGVPDGSGADDQPVDDTEDRTARRLEPASAGIAYGRVG